MSDQDRSAPAASVAKPARPRRARAAVVSAVAAVAPSVVPAEDAPAATLSAPKTVAKDQTMNDTVKAFAEKAQEQAKNFFGQAGDQTKSAMEKSKKAAEDMAEFSKGNVEALMESSRIAAKGLETMGQDAAAFLRARYDSTAQVVNAVATVKSPTELFQLQADFLRGTFDAMVAEASRSTEATLKLAGEVAAPIQNRVALAADKIKIAA
ncbi:MAG: phasin [Sphingomonas sp.]|jgi:phasin family protein|uniref:phasin family protein n=1 Tax=Sphingomonas sp. TaxID=28214 RepID=UPI000DBC20B5|nr:TIGR01841 family phasin [Sphingomonas sp.]PZU80518.1 MAG: phasin [Sphingomonas sp.]